MPEPVGRRNRAPHRDSHRSRNKDGPFIDHDSLIAMNENNKNQIRSSKGPCLKYVLFACNLVIIVIGVCILALGVWLKCSPKFRKLLSEEYRQAVGIGTICDPATFYILTWVFIGLGCLMILFSFFGCCGAIRESPSLLVVNFVCLACTFLATLGAGSLLFYKRDNIENEISDIMVCMVQKYYQGAGIIQEAADAIQQTFRCCGNSGCGTYRNLNLDRPRSCTSCDGCRDRIYRAFRVGFQISTALFSFALIAEIVAMVLSLAICALVRKYPQKMSFYAPPTSSSLATCNSSNSQQQLVKPSAYEMNSRPPVPEPDPRFFTQSTVAKRPAYQTPNQYSTTPQPQQQQPQLGYTQPQYRPVYDRDPRQYSAQQAQPQYR